MKHSLMFLLEILSVFCVVWVFNFKVTFGMKAQKVKIVPPPPPSFAIAEKCAPHVQLLLKIVPPPL